MAHCMVTYKQIIVSLASKYGEKVPKQVLQVVNEIYGTNMARTKLEIRRAVETQDGE